MNDNPRRLGPAPLSSVLASSIAGDPGIAAMAGAADAALLPVIKAVPKMLLWARLWQDETRLTPALRRIAEHCGGLPPLTDDELELLAWQTHVDFWSPSWPRPIREDLVKNSTRWHRIKGTPASMKQAFDLYGIRADIEEDGTGANWATYQLGLADTPDPMTVRLAYDIARETAPARCRLFRIYNEDFDFRPIILTEGPALSEGWLSFYSGVPSGIEDEEGPGPIVSFGQRRAFSASTVHAAASFGVESLFAMLCRYLDKFIVGQSAIGDAHVKNGGFSVTELASFRWTEPKRAWRFRYRSILRSQAVPGEDVKVLSDNNTRLGLTVAETIDDPARLSAFRLSEHDPALRSLVLEEMFLFSASCATAPAHPAVSGLTISQSAGFGAGPLVPRRRWSGPWRSEPWYPYSARFSVTHHQLEEEM